jgi:hypothetical protein
MSMNLTPRQANGRLLPAAANQTCNSPKRSNVLDKLSQMKERQPKRRNLASKPLWPLIGSGGIRP